MSAPMIPSAKAAPRGSAIWTSTERRSTPVGTPAAESAASTRRRSIIPSTVDTSRLATSHLGATAIRQDDVGGRLGEPSQGKGEVHHLTKGRPKALNAEVL